MEGIIYQIFNSKLKSTMQGEIEEWSHKELLRVPKKPEPQLSIDEEEPIPIPNIKYDEMKIYARCIIRDKMEEQHCLLFMYYFTPTRNLVLDDVHNFSAEILQKPYPKPKNKIVKVKLILAKFFGNSRSR